MPKPMPRRLVLAALLTSLAACGPALLNSVDGVARLGAGPGRVAASVPYGAHPRQRLDVYAPRRAERLPVVVFFYGGAWSSGSRGAYAFAGRAYAGQGFVAVVPDYRLVPDVRFPAFVQDGAAAIRWVRDNVARYGGDPDRITVVGHSAGAHIAALLALDVRWLREAGVDPRTIKAGALLSGPYDFLPLTDARSQAALGNWPRPAETQPISFARPDAPPLLLATGMADTTVRPRNSQALAAKLQAAGAPVELKLYPGAGHADPVIALARPFRGRVPALADSAAFLRRHAQ
ncbi:alpha/beta hydrolase [Sphingomonas lenta]|nr:alpha/beta hydrolase [Sphingomonas lenta]